MQLFKRITIATALSLTVLTAQAELTPLPEVSEARSRKPMPPMSSNADNYELAQQVQWLQEELQNLRGTLEITEHEIEQLQARQRDLYADLDGRIAEIRQELASNAEAKADPLAAAKPAPAPAANVAAVEAEEIVVATNVTSDEKAYRAAYDLLQSKNYSAAMDAFDIYVEDNPEGQYRANAYYWLGESQVIYGDLDKAEASFRAVVEQYPLHQKAADAMLKLGYVYDSAGEQDKAIATLTEVKQKYPNSSVARLADQRLVQIKQNNAPEL